MVVKKRSIAAANDSVDQDELANAVIARHRSNEIFFAVVGPVGAGGSRVISSLKRVCADAEYTPIEIKASDLIREWHLEKFKSALPNNKNLDTVEKLQNAGDEIRRSDPSNVAKEILGRIAQSRADSQKISYSRGEAVLPDEKKRAYLIDSIRHPAEIHLLRRTYGSAFALIGVVCEESERIKRIGEKYFTKPQLKNKENIKRLDVFISRDADDPNKSYGQHVTDSFFESDFFINNTKLDENDTHQYLDESCGRLIDIITHARVTRPTIEETAMHHAHSARVRSACLSRQVGASLLDSDGTVVATGANEVPAAGGGVYGEASLSSNRYHEGRCAFRKTKYCSSNREQNRLIDELIEKLPELKQISDRDQLIQKIRKTSIGGLLEFSRAVHAEMDVLLSAAREGISTVGGRLFVTTFPCHYCARHIVSAGIYEVQYIEPYPKSLATDLHDDAIETDETRWIPPQHKTMKESREQMTADSVHDDQESVNFGKVLFTPFVGVAPRLYLRAFEKTWRLKDKTSGDFKMQPPEWGDDWASFTIGYPELEAALTK